MNRFMLGRKAGMTQLFDEHGLMIPVTVIDCGPLTVVQNKTEEIEGYQAVKVGFDQYKKHNKPAIGQFTKVNVEPMRILREFRDTEQYETGQTIKVDEMFEAGDKVDISGTSKGKGFQGSIRRHGFSKGPMSHGSKYHRGPGSMGSSATPARVQKGKKLPGQLGNKRTTVQNLEVVQVDGERNILVVKGAVPGPKGGLLEIKTSVKAR
ncbi:MAG: 50S ribosomal protein L3 [Clostridiaceae bacterium]|jgi:large subunit ribosomal protein L3|nr:50S ribosomal protein L3 [Bacillota bacterium]NLN51774.1 50S ribosomal protein L3 [Clostridiaceae bacterium]